MARSNPHHHVITMSFTRKLEQAWASSNSLLTVGLDPDPARFPAELRGKADAIFEFCRTIADVSAPYASSFKPQIAYFAAQRAEDQLEALCAYIRREHPHIPVVLDAKRGDIGSTAQQYAVEAFERYGADAVTVSPYMGSDSIEPYFEWPDRGVIVLCRTSNAGGSDLQFLETDGEPLYLRVASLVADKWNRHGQCGLVVGATFPAELAAVRARVGAQMPLLVPGIGAQGGDVLATVQAGCNAAGTGVMINSARAILYASNGDDWREAAARMARETRDAINDARKAAQSAA
jgi:orotidine-5'-phosphate decarboxylase